MSSTARPPASQPPTSRPPTPLPQAAPPQQEYAVAARWTAIVAAAVTLFLVVTLVMTVREERRITPLDSPEMTALKAQLLDRPNDEAIKEQLRQRDLELRSGYFARLERTSRGAWLLVFAGAALALALKSHSALTRRVEIPSGHRIDTSSEMRLARVGVALSALTLVSVSAAWAIWGQPPFPTVTVEAPAEVAAREVLARNFVAFRGLDGSGHVTGSMPQTWDGATGEGILWKTALPLPGHSSPVIFGNSVMVSASDGNLQEVICVDADSGAIRWRGGVPRGSLQTPEVFDDTGFAAPTPVTDGARVYAIFASGDVGAFDIASGRRVWARTMGRPQSMYGYASSLALHDGNIIIQWDHGDDPEEGVSALICLDGATGKPVWRTPRPVANGWASPIVVDGVVYTLGLPWVIAYNATDGRELWRAKLMEGDVAPTPVVANGVVYVANERAVAAAIRTGGEGDVTETHVLWKTEEITLPDMVSPITDGKHVLFTHGGGEMSCLDAATGEIRWTHLADHMVHASPIFAGGLVYLIDYEGDTYVFELKETFELLRTMKLGEKVAASPAVVNGRMYVRTEEHLLCIGR